MGACPTRRCSPPTPPVRSLLTPGATSPGSWRRTTGSGAAAGVWAFNPEGVGKDRAVSRNREAKHAHVGRGTVRQVLVYDGGDCVGWCQYGPPAELPAIKNPKACNAGLTELPDWRIGCIFTGKGHRRTGIARAAVAGALAAIKEAGAGSSRHTPSRSRVGNPSAAPTSTPARRTCPGSSDSSATDGSPSGAG